MLAACASLYRELIKAGIDPVRADEMELWQIASLMGPADEKSAPGAPGSAPPTQSDALLRERVRRQREGLPPIDESELEAYDDIAVRGTEQMLRG